MLKHLKQATNYTTTANGATTHVTTESYLLDFFSRAGSMRDVSESEIRQLFSKAFDENQEYALKTLFLHRDIREGNGERRVFRICANWLSETEPEALEKLIPLIAEYGRWDDVVDLIDTKAGKVAIDVLKKQLYSDSKNHAKGNSISLLAKWLPSVNTSSHETKRKAKKLIKAFGWNEKQYRKTLATLRSYINILERNMSQKTWDKVDYSSLPSQAMMKYRQAFHRNDLEKFSKYLESLSKGETKINAGSLYPYQLVEKAMSWGISDTDRKVYNEMWSALPDRIEGTDNSIAVVDVSGSMSGRPMHVAISLGMYMAERNTGVYHNHFITFSKKPQLLKINGRDFVARVQNMEKADWGMSTNLESVFDLILDTAIKNNVPQEELPTSLYIFSDMQFNQAVGHRSDESFFKTMKTKYKAHGYNLPKVIFWNVNGEYGQQSPVTMHTENTQLVSGFSQNLFKSIMTSTAYNPYELMMDALNSERYAPIIYKG